MSLNTELHVFFAVQCNPRMEVRDLFRDIQDGKILMALLEELSGCKLVGIISVDFLKHFTSSVRMNDYKNTDL